MDIDALALSVVHASDEDLFDRIKAALRTAFDAGRLSPKSACGVEQNLRRAGLYEIAEQVSVTHCVSVDAMLGRSRSRGPRTARRDLFLRLRLRGLSLKEIGALVDRHHTTVIHCLQPLGKEQARISTEPEVLRKLCAGRIAS